MRKALAIFLIFFALCGCTAQKKSGELDAARAAYANGNFSEAERLYEGYLQFNATGAFRWEAWNRLLDISLNVFGNNEKAAGLLEAMSLEFSNDPEQSWKLVSKLAQLHEDAKQWNEAITTWQSAFEIKGLDESYYPEIYLRMARITKNSTPLTWRNKPLKPANPKRVRRKQKPAACMSWR